MAVTSGSRIQYEYMLGGGPPVILEAPEGYSATGWDQGTVLIWDATGHFEFHTSGNVAQGVLGIALSPMSATADESETKPFIFATPNTVFSAVVAHATTASAVLDNSNFFKSYMLTNSATVCPSTNVWVIDLATASTAAGAYIIGAKDATGTAYGRAYFIFNGRSYSTDSPWNDNVST
jgi:hypothetical protein